MTVQLKSIEVELPEIDKSGSGQRASGTGWQRAKVILALLSLAVAYYGFWRIRGMYLDWADNSDILYLASLYRDLVSHHYPLTGWRLTPAPYFFPDMPLFFFSAAVTRNLPSAYCLYSGIMLSAILGCMYWIARAISSSRADRLLAVGLMALLMFVLTLRSHSYWIPMRWLLAPSGHSGTLLCGMILLGLTLEMVRRPRIKLAIGFASISFIALASDQLLLSQFLAPIVFATLLGAVVWRHRSSLIAGGVIAVSSLIAWRAALLLLQQLTRGGSLQIRSIQPQLAPWSLITYWWPQFKQDWQEVAAPTRPLFIVAIASLLAVMVTLAHMRRQRRRGQDDGAAEAVSFTTWIAICSWVLSFAIPVLTALWGNVDTFRYELSFLVLPLLLLAMCVAYTLCRLSGAAGAVLGLAACAMGIIFSAPMFRAPAVSNESAFYTPTIAAFDQLKRQYGLHAGFADYWLSRPVTLFSKEHVVINPMDADGTALLPVLWIDNPNHWCQKPDGKPGEYPVYDFVVCPPISAAKIRERYGAPAKVVECAGTQVLIYNRPSDVLFRSIGRAQATTSADAPLASRIVKIRFLNHAKPPGYPWTGSDTKILYPGHPIELRLTKPVVADVLNITANSGLTYQIELKMGERLVGKTELPPIPGDNLQPHDLLLTDVTGGKAFDRVVITPDKAPGFYSIGSVMVFTDPILHPIKISKRQRQ